MIANPLVQLLSSDPLDKLIQAYLDDCKAIGLRPRTVEGYQDMLERFLWWCRAAQRPLDVTQHDRALLRAFMAYVREPGVKWETQRTLPEASQATQHAYYRTLSAFYSWLVREDWLEAHPMAKLRAPRRGHEQPDPFTVEELKRIKEALSARASDPLIWRDRAIVAILLDVGLRASELLQIRVADTSIVSGDLRIVEGKGGKPRQVVLGIQARRAVRRYWTRTRHMYGAGGPLFVTLHGDQLTYNGLQQVVRRIGRQADVSPCNLHRFRHTFAVNAIRAGMSAFELQVVLGHADLTMTRRYVKLVEEDIREAARDHSPLDKMNLGI